MRGNVLSDGRMESPLRSALGWSPSLKHSQAGARGLAHPGAWLAFPLLPLAPVWIRTRVALFFFFFFLLSTTDAVVGALNPCFHLVFLQPL